MKLSRWAMSCYCLLMLQVLSSMLFAGGTAYVTNRSSVSVSAIDIDTQAVIATPSVGNNPYRPTATPDGSKVYVANAGSLFTSIINTATNTVTSVAVAGGHIGLAVTPDGSKVYVPCYSAKTVSVIATATDTLITDIDFGTRSPGNQPAITPDGSKAYVTCQNTTEVGVIDIASNTISTFISVSRNPVQIKILPDGSKAYVLCNTDDKVVVIDVATDTIVATIDVADQPSSLVFTPDGLKAFMSVIFGNVVQVIDTTTDAVIETISFSGGDFPFVIAMHPDGSKAYVSLFGANEVASIDTTTYAFTRISVGSAPFDVDFQPDGLKAYVTNRSSDDVSIIDTATETVDSTVAVGTLPWFIAIAQLLPPSGLTVTQENDVFLTQTDLINVIGWELPAGARPAQYRIYRDAGLTQLIGTVDGSGKLEFKDHNRTRNQSYSYYVVSVDANGSVSDVISITITP